MTVSYNLAVSNTNPLPLFRLLLRWRGSLWKMVIYETVIWLSLFTAINVTCSLTLDDAQKKKFTQIARWLQPVSSKVIPMEFMLGFFVTAVVSRWTTLLNNIGFTERLSLTVAGYIRGTSEAVRILRRNLLRYVCLFQALVYRDISERVMKRFPTVDTVVAAGLMLPHEKEKLDATKSQEKKYWVPIQWAMSLMYKARMEGYIEADLFCDRVCEEILDFRDTVELMLRYDWVPLPIAYPQLIYLAVHVYFFIALIADQELWDPSVSHYKLKPKISFQ
ncbi:hypothetical protein AB6A40_000881 [Gnathostoma spinigerum]|uniref:Bestrophin homolog n=1 Tax=Gnathostoma spinigerum TaxID=75299 RepID=A0ABD6E526_9BILA